MLPFLKGLNLLNLILNFKYGKCHANHSYLSAVELVEWELRTFSVNGDWVPQPSEADTMLSTLVQNMTFFLVAYYVTL